MKSRVSLCCVVLALACRSSAEPEGASSNTRASPDAVAAKRASPDAQVDAPPLWTAGKRYRFAVAASTTLDLGGPTGRVSYDLKAQLDVGLAPSGVAETTLVLHIEEPVIASRTRDKQPAFDQIAKELGRSHAVAVYTGGRLQKLGMTPGASTSCEASYRQIASSLQMVAQPKQGTVEVEESDTTGRCLTRYQPGQVPGSFEKVKLRYLDSVGMPSGLDPKQVTINPDIVKSSGRVTLGPEGGLASVELHDEVVVKGAQVPVRASNDLELSREAVLEESRSESELAGLRAGIELVSVLEVNKAKPRLEVLDRARTGGASFEEILGRMKTELAKDSKRAAANGKRAKRKRGPVAPAGELEFEEGGKHLIALTAALRSEPGAAEKAVAMVEAGSPLSNELIDALGSASGPKSEAGLIKLMASNDEDIRGKALFALSQAQRPSQRIVNAMLGVLTADPFNQSALYGLGTYARWYRDEGIQDKAKTLGDYLVNRLGEARGPMDTVIALRAIENAGYAGALPALQRYLRSSDQTISEAATSALGPINDPVVDEFLAFQLNNAPPGVRVWLIKAAGVREPTDRVAEAMTSTFASTDRTGRYRAVEVMMKWLPKRPQLRAFLEGVSANDPEPRIRNFAKRAL